jgi:hypothetical protein
VDETSTPPPSRHGSDASDPPDVPSDLSRSVTDLNEFQVTSHDAFDEKVLEGDEFKWHIPACQEEKGIELTNFHSSNESDTYDDLPPLIDPSDEDDNNEEDEGEGEGEDEDEDQDQDEDEEDEDEDEDEDKDEDWDCEEEEGSTESGYSDRELEEEEESEEEEEESLDQQLRVQTSEEYPSLIRFLFYLFLFLHLVSYAHLLKEREERGKLQCFQFNPYR